VIDQIGRSSDLSAMTRVRRFIVRETVGLYEAKTHLSELVERAAEGEEIVISKSGKPKARLVPLDDVRPLREPGHGRGEWKLGNDFDEPLPEDILDEFEGGGS
jgi:prevent-host-death family protein